MQGGEANGEPMIPRETGTLTADGDMLYYEAVGEDVPGADPVVLCHGLGGNAGVWFQQVPVLARHRRVVVWDQRGFGRSTDRHDRSVESATDDLGRVLDHLGIERAHVVGQSMGGWAALGHALRHPDRVRSLVLSASTGGIPAAPAEAAQRVGTPSGAGERPLGVHPALGERLRERDPAAAYLYQVLGSFGDHASDSAIAARLGRRTHETGDLPRLDLPVLMVCGEQDPLFPPAVVRAAAAMLPRARVVELSGVGHSGYFEDAPGWNRAVTAFLADG